MVHRVKNLMSRAHKMITVLFLCSRTREFNLGGGGGGGHSSNSVEKKLKNDENGRYYTGTCFKLQIYIKS